MKESIVVDDGFGNTLSGISLQMDVFIRSFDNTIKLPGLLLFRNISSIP